MQDDHKPKRREFLGHVGLLALTASMPVGVALGETIRSGHTNPTWDMSWVDRVAAAPYKAVIDAMKLDNDPLYTAADIMDRFHEVYDTPDTQTRVVVVMRHFGAAMGVQDALWDKYAIGEERSVTDPVTKAPARRNPFLRAAPNVKESWEISGKIEPLIARGMTALVCNRALMSLASSLAKKANKPVEEVQNDLRSGLVPGAYLMPTGIFALIRAQNAGCALYREA
jgi:intracellular sulfur oxidation DsrE/DsrF family protein